MINVGGKYIATRRCGSIRKVDIVTVKEIQDARIYVDVGAYALTRDEFVSIFGNKKEGV